jgi:hypothetical protein
LLADSGLREKLSEGARQTFEQYFCENVAAERILKEAESLVRKGSDV